MATIWQYPATWSGGELARSTHASTSERSLNREIRDNMLASQAVLAETVLTAKTGAVPLLDLTAPSTVWNNWRLIASAANSTSGSQVLQIYFNQDRSTVYQQSSLVWAPSSTAAGASTGAGATGATEITLGRPSPSTALPSAFCSYVVNVAGVNSTRHKLVTGISAGIDNTAGGGAGGAVTLYCMSGIYRSTAKLTIASFALDLIGSEFSSGSIFTLIGLP